MKFGLLTFAIFVHLLMPLMANSNSITLSIGQAYTDDLKAKLFAKVEYMETSIDSESGIPQVKKEPLHIVRFYHANSGKLLIIRLDEKNRIQGFYCRKSEKKEFVYPQRITWSDNINIKIDEHDITMK